MPSFTLNIAVDHLLKKEFDIHRAKAQTHPLMEHYGVDAVPFVHPMLDQWRENFVGVQYHHKKTNLIFFGAVDDLWVNKKGEVHVVDYKATSKDGDVVFGDSKWHDAYKNQMEMYQWLLRNNNLKVSSVGYFVYVNGKKDREAFDGKLEFDVTIFPYKGDDSWVEKELIRAHECLMSDTAPKPTKGCEYCEYREASEAVLAHAPKKSNKKSISTQNNLFE